MAVRIRRQDKAAIVQMDWPERRNALGPDEAGQLADALGVAGDPGVRALVLTGSGAFCAGGDLSQLAILVQQGLPRCRGTRSRRTCGCSAERGRPASTRTYGNAWTSRSGC